MGKQANKTNINLSTDLQQKTLTIFLEENLFSDTQVPVTFFHVDEVFFHKNIIHIICNGKLFR